MYRLAGAAIEQYVLYVAAQQLSTTLAQGETLPQIKPIADQGLEQCTKYPPVCCDIFIFLCVTAPLPIELVGSRILVPLLGLGGSGLAPRPA